MLEKTPSFPCLKVVAPAARAEELSWLLADLGASGVELRDDSTMEQSKEGFSELIAGFPTTDARAAAERSLRGLGAGDLEIRAVDIADDGWSTRWREHFRPVVLEKLQVVTPWMTPPRPDLISIVIDPGQAFGTGGHATTRLILRMLERRAAEGALPESLLDVGTGSGILAVAAARLGARKVTAIDIDAASAEAARANAAANRVAGRIGIRHGPISDLRGRWPLVLANLELAIFAKYAPDIAGCVANGGGLLLSGLLADQVAPCLELWPGFRTLDSQEEDGWAALALERTA